MLTDELLIARLREEIDGLEPEPGQVDAVVSGVRKRVGRRRTRVRLGAAAAGVAIAAGGVALVLFGGHVMPQRLPAGPVPSEPAVERPLPLWTGRRPGPAPDAPRPRATAFTGQAEIIPGDRPGVGVRLDDGRLVGAVWPTGYRAAVAGDGALVLRDRDGVNLFRFTARTTQPTRVHLAGRLGSNAPDGNSVVLEVDAVEPERWAHEPVVPTVPDRAQAWRMRAESLRTSVDAELGSEPWYAGSYLNEATTSVVAQIRPGDPVEISRADTRLAQVWRQLPGAAGVISRIEVSDHPIRDARRLADELQAYGREHPDDLPVASADVLASNTIALHVPNYQQDRVRGRLTRLLAQDPWRVERPERYGFAVVGDRPPRALPDWETPQPSSPSLSFDLGLPTGDEARNGVPDESAFGPRTRVGGFVVRLGYDDPCWALSTPNTLLAIPRWPAGWRAGVEDTFVLRDARDGVRADGALPWVMGEGRLGPAVTGGRCAGLPGTLDLGDGAVFGAVPPPPDARLPGPELGLARQRFHQLERRIGDAFPTDDPAFGGVYWHPVWNAPVVQVRAGSTPGQQAALRALIARLAPDPVLRWRYVVTERSLWQGRRLAEELSAALKDDRRIRGGIGFGPDWGGTVTVQVVPGQEQAVRARLEELFRGPLAGLRRASYPVTVLPSYQPGDPGYDALRRR